MKVRKWLYKQFLGMSLRMASLILRGMVKALRSYSRMKQRIRSLLHC
ncbi:hypothetical protein [Bacillus sp. B-jedd]|nr:hypothetical protein [Bacillus sp. B-jedd]